MTFGEKRSQIFSRCFLYKRARWLGYSVVQNIAESSTLCSAPTLKTINDKQTDGRTTDGIVMTITERNVLNVRSSSIPHAVASPRLIDIINVKKTVVYTRVNGALHIKNCKNYKKVITHQHIA